MIPLLIDENLSRKLINSILDIFPQSKHIAECSLLISNDNEIWEFAEISKLDPIREFHEDDNICYMEIE